MAKYFMGLKKAERTALEAEVVSNDARLKLTRLLRKRCESKDQNVDLINRNQCINTARTVLGLSIYQLEPDDWGMYMNEEFGWHFAETELVMRRPDTAQLIEILADMLQQGMLDVSDVNDILVKDNVSVRFETTGFDDNISVHFLSEEEIEEDDNTSEHPNIRLLMTCMEASFERKDYAGVLHASASIFETLAKLVFENTNVENKSLASFFDGYRQRSGLPPPVLDYILDTYKRRNVEPLAAHGATTAPTIVARDASILIEMTKMCVRLERRLATQEVDAALAKGAAQRSTVASKPAATGQGNRRKVKIKQSQHKKAKVTTK